MKGTKKLEAAKKFADWSSSKEAAALYAKNYAIVAIPGIAQPLPNIPADYEKRLVKNDFAWAREESRQDPRRMEQALQREGGAQVSG